MKPRLLLMAAMILLAGNLSAQDLLVYEGGVGGTQIVDNEAVGGMRDFGIVPVGVNSQTLVIAFVNNGSTTLTGFNWSKHGADPGDFYVTQSPPLSLSPGQTGIMEVVFNSATQGVKTATIDIPHNGTGSGTSPFEINLRATAVLPQLEVTINSVVVTHQQAAAGTDRDFGFQDVAAGPTAALTIFVRNVGTGTLVLSTPSMIGAWWNQFTLNTHGMHSSLGAGQATAFTVAFDPSTSGAMDAFIRLFHTCPVQPSPYEIPVVGTGFVTPVPEMSLECGAQFIGNGGSYHHGVTEAGSPVVLQILINNTGLTDLHLTGTPLVEILTFVGCTVNLASTPASVITPGSGTTFILGIVPLAYGPWSVGISILNNSPSPLFTATFQGTGVVVGTELRVFQQPTNATTGAVFHTTPLVVITNGYGAIDTGDNTTQVQVSITPGSGSAGAVLGGTVTRTAVNGYVYFDDLTIDRDGVAYTLTFEDLLGPKGTVHSAAFDVALTGGGGGGSDDDECSTGDNQGVLLLVILLGAMATVARRQRRQV